MKYKLSPANSKIKPHAVRMKPYDPEWLTKARRITDQLAFTLGDNLVTVEHIGSTAIPGIWAKPVIDLLPIVRNINAFDSQQHLIRGLGYQCWGEFGIVGRRFCTLSDAHGERLVHLHFFQQDAPHIERHLAFRDYMLNHTEIAKAYQVEKLRAAQLHPGDSMAYNDEKAAWVQKYEKEALKWYRAKHKKNYIIRNPF